MYLSKVEQMSDRLNKYAIRLVPWNKYYSIIFFLLEQILLGTNIRLHYELFAPDAPDMGYQPWA